MNMPTRLMLIPAIALGLIGCSNDADTPRTNASEPGTTAQADYPLDVCIVSGEELGSMGDPIEVTVQDHTFKLCCSSCEAELRENPDKYIKMLEEATPPAEVEDHSGHNH